MAIRVCAIILFCAGVAGADDLGDSVPASHSERRLLEVDVSCPPALPAGAASQAVTTLRNHRHGAVTVTRGALTVHAGALRVIGPRSIPLDAMIDAAGPDGSPGAVAVNVPIVMPTTAARRTLVTFGLTVLGRAGTSARRSVLGIGSCTVEVGNPDVDVLTAIHVEPASRSTVVGGTVALVARGVFASGAVQQPLAGVVWSTDAASVATVGATGVATGRALGTARIRASRDGLLSGAATVTVKPRVATSLALAGRTFDDGVSVQLGATAFFNDGTSALLTTELGWTSAAPAVASISPTGSLMTHRAGSTLITATHPDGVSVAATFGVVVPAGLPAITSVFPSSGSALGGTVVTVLGVNFTLGSTAGIGLGAEGGFESFPPADVTIVSDGEMRITTGPGRPGVVANVSVTNSRGTAVMPRAFTYVLPFTVPGTLALATGTAGVLTVTLPEPRTGATTVTLVNADASVATLAPSATIPAGQTSVDVVVNAIAAISDDVPVKATAVTVSIGGASQITNVMVSAPFTGALDLVGAIPGIYASGPPIAAVPGLEIGLTLPGTLALSSGATRTVTFSLATPAPAGGLCVSLSSSRPAVATVPPPVCIDPGEQTFEFDVTAVGAGRSAVSAVAGNEIFTFDALVNETAPVVSEILARPIGVEVAQTLLATLGVGLSATRTVTLTLAASAPADGLCTALASNSPGVASVPAQSCIVEGARTVAFGVTGVATGQAIVTATAGGETFQLSVFVNQTVPVFSEILARPVGAEVAATLLATVGVTSGASKTLTITLAAPAPPGGRCATLTSANPAVATVPTEPSCITQGEQTLGFAVTGVAIGQTIITATAGSEVFQFNALVNQTAPVFSEILARPVGVEVPPTLLATVGVGLSATKAVTLALAAPAPGSGLCATLQSHNPAVATVPLQSCVAAGEQALPVEITGAGTGQTLLTVRAGDEVIQLNVFVNANQSVATINEVVARPVSICTVENPVSGQRPPTGCESR